MGRDSSFGERLRRHRELAGLTQEELAERSGLTAKAIGLIERGERRSPYPHTIHALAEGLGLGAAEREGLLVALPRRGRHDSAGAPMPPAGATSGGIAPAVASPAAGSAATVANQPRWEPRSWFPPTKLRPPQAGGAIVRRAQLLAQVRTAVLTHRLTLLAAPAGSGKTTLLATLPDLLPGVPVAWLALDADDNDPASFAAALLTAVRQALPGSGTLSQALFDGLPDPGAHLRQLFNALINDLPDLSADHFVLALDDLQALPDPAIHEALDHLIERLPEGAHIVATSRYDPPLALARLRARGQLAEFRLADLRFTPAEADDLLNGRLALGLTGAEVAALHERAGGWAAGLRLLALRLGRLPSVTDRHALIARLGEAGRHVFDFLAEEVLHQQEPELQRFLLDASVLTELTPELCRAVTGRDDAAQLLDRAYRRNLFLTLTGGPVIDTGHAFRFHGLFAAFLRERLNGDSPGRARDLHRRAAEATTDTAQAVAHYCAAEHWEAAAKAIEIGAPQLARHGMYRRLRDWIAVLPTEVREAHPKLLHFLGTFAFYTGDWEEARSLLDRAQAGMTTGGDHAAALESTMLLIVIDSRTRDGVSIDEWVAKASEHGPLPVRFRAFLGITRAWSRITTGDYAPVEEIINGTVNLLLASDDPADWNLPPLAPPLALGPNGPTIIEAYCQEAQRRFGDGVSLVSATVAQLQGYLQLVRGRLHDAALAADRANSLSEQLGEIGDFHPGITETFYALALIRGDPMAAERYVTGQLPQIERNRMLRGWLPGYRYLIAKARWLAGRTAEARAAARTLAEGGPFPAFGLLPQAQALLDGMLATSDGHHAEAEHHLRAASAFRPPYYTVLFWLDHPQVLLAHCYERWGRPREALAALGPVLAECERLDTPGIILKVGQRIAPLLRLATAHQVHADFAARLLALLDAPDAGPGGTADIAVPRTGVMLSPREDEVLRLLAAGASNAAIAEALFISHNTAKTHVAHILAKLGVASRTAAAARARDLGIG